jgi:hypothetical protein
VGAADQLPVPQTSFFPERVTRGLAVFAGSVAGAGAGELPLPPPAAALTGTTSDAVASVSVAPSSV